MSEMLDKLEINAESALDFDDTTLVVPMTLVREMFERLEAENAALKRENEAWRQAGEAAIKQLGTLVGLMSITALLTAEEQEDE